jgi:hypothetical protein
VRSAAGETIILVCGCEIRCFGHESEDEKCPVKEPELEHCVRRYTARSATLRQTTVTPRAPASGWT